MSTETTAARGHPRIAALDVLRGFALCGILLVNVRIITSSGPPPAADLDDPLVWLGLATSQRFLPVFALLFGMGFALLAESAARRSRRPRLVLLRRLLALLAIGLPHLLLWPGEILTAYAVLGLAVLLPSTWLPRWAVAVLSAACLAVGLAFGGGGPLLVAGLFLLGAALVRYGAARRLDGPARTPALLGLAFAAGALPALWWQVRAAASDSPAFGTALGLAGLLMAGAYVCAVLVLLRTPLRPVLRAAFEPLGRMALTNDLTATVLVLAAGRLLGLEFDTLAQVLLTAGAVLGAQWMFSVLWLRRYRQGPVEWVWRWATWAGLPSPRASPSAG
ncbi:putative membrane protein YeiB [Streptomonospora nanhaiensis]|uniref:Putative membrane protein YeiB n=1 Tax=Streptomonospora nanhaiensis TaxID=1323731 RepID=A0A853BRN2_9ACTN|nr:DUF418 domain-containing protein [Streptomonospora nanhaiensis]NYI97366.1 putative membrane protein YeiB [Streptomonospora nanhaiensis]